MLALWKLIDEKVLLILNTFMKNPNEQYHIKKLSTTSKVSLASTFRIVNKLVKLDIIEIVKVGEFKLYKIDEKKANMLIELLGDTK